VDRVDRAADERLHPRALRLRRRRPHDVERVVHRDQQRAPDLAFVPEDPRDVELDALSAVDLPRLLAVDGRPRAASLVEPSDEALHVFSSVIAQIDPPRLLHHDDDARGVPAAEEPGRDDL
jgi:hypothetical protein